MKPNDVVKSKATGKLYKVESRKEGREGYLCIPLNKEDNGTYYFFEDEVEIVASIAEIKGEAVSDYYKTLLCCDKSSNIKLETKEDILAVDAAMDQIEKRVKEVATYLGFLDNTWHFEDFGIGKETIHVTAYDLYYDLHETKLTSFPIECILDEEFLKRYKKEWDEAKRVKEEKERLAEQQRIEDKEKAELERLKAKYE